jgi:hypothetical protein
MYSFLALVVCSSYIFRSLRSSARSLEDRNQRVSWSTLCTRMRSLCTWPRTRSSACCREPRCRICPSFSPPPAPVCYPEEIYSVVTQLINKSVSRQLGYQMYGRQPKKIWLAKHFLFVSYELMFQKAFRLTVRIHI